MKNTGRTHHPTSVSLPPEIKDKTFERVKTLYPRVSSFSNYVVQLILLDFEKGLVGPAEKHKRSLPMVAEANMVPA